MHCELPAEGWPAVQNRWREADVKVDAVTMRDRAFEESIRQASIIQPVMAAPIISRRLDAVDGLRGLAILAVLLYHIKNGVMPAEAEPAIFDLGWAGVDLFFVLSGFLITGILWDSRERGNYFKVFYARRTLRIFPLYFLVLFAIYVVGPAALRAFHRSSIIRGFIHPETQIYAWTYVLNVAMAFSIPITGMLGHFWSLSIEEQFYLAWPLVIRNFSRCRLIQVCAAMIVVSLLLRTAFYLYGWNYAAYVLTICRMDGLAIGAVIALALRNHEDWLLLLKFAPAVTMLSAVSVAILAWHSAAFSGVWMLTAGLTAFGLFFGGCLTLAVHFEPGFLKMPTLRFFGKYSYCLYCVHQPIIQLLVRAGFAFDVLVALVRQPAFAAVITNFMLIGVSVAVALASWHLFEKHFLRLKDRIH
jgi:peptidoglycan/LPS O-acetylase OafA/YrhL